MSLFDRSMLPESRRAGHPLGRSDDDARHLDSARPRHVAVTFIPVALAAVGATLAVAIDAAQLLQHGPALQPSSAILNVTVGAALGLAAGFAALFFRTLRYSQFSDRSTTPLDPDALELPSRDATLSPAPDANGAVVHVAQPPAAPELSGPALSNADAPSPSPDADERNPIDDWSRQRVAAIGRELHDVVGQQLTGVSLLLGALQQRRERSPSDVPPQEAELLDNARHQLDHAFDAARAVSRKLHQFADRPAEIEDADRLITAGATCGRVVRTMVAQAGRVFGDDVRLRAEVAADLEALRGSWIAPVAAVAREAITNAVRHGSARNVHVVLFTQRQDIVLEVVDDGPGIDLAPDGHASEGLGIRTMRARAERLDGVLSLGTWRQARAGLAGEQGGFVRLAWPLLESPWWSDGNDHPRRTIPRQPATTAETRDLS